MRDAAEADHAVVGASDGGRVAIDLALERPDRVAALVLASPALGGWAWSQEVRSFGAAEDELLEAGKVDEAADLNVRTWVDGNGRGPDEVDGEVRELGPGGLCHVESTTPRQITSVGDEDLVMLVVGAKDGYVGRDGQLADPSKLG